MHHKYYIQPFSFYWFFYSFYSITHIRNDQRPDYNEIYNTNTHIHIVKIWLVISMAWRFYAQYCHENPNLTFYRVLHDLRFTELGHLYRYKRDHQPILKMKFRNNRGTPDAFCSVCFNVAIKIL